MQTLDVDAEFDALTAQMFLIPEVDPGSLPDWLTDEEMLPDDEPVPGRHAKRYCPWTDVVVPESAQTGTLAVQDAAVASMLDQPVAFIKSPTAKHAHDGTALAMIDHAADELRAALKQRSVPRRVLRSLLDKLEAMR